MKNEEYEFCFEKLRVWKQARVFTKEIYEMTRLFPKEELYCLSNQIRRAAISITSNIAEGSTRFSKKDFAHFIHFAYSSLMEVLNQLYIALDLNYIEETVFISKREQISLISNQLNALHKSLLKS